MLAKITLTLEQDEQRGTNTAMEETIKLLATLENIPTTKLVLTLECEEMIAESYRAKLRHGLRRRPIGIIAKIKTTSEEQINIEVMRPTTPMDTILGFAEKHGAHIEFETPDTGARAKEWAERTQRLHVAPSDQAPGEQALEWLEAREQD